MKKSILLFIITLLLTICVYADVTSYKYPSTAANADRDGKEAWTNVNDAKTDNGASADSPKIKSTYSDWLRLTNFGFTSADIPTGSTINGIEMVIEKKTKSDPIISYIEDSALYLRDSGGQVGDNTADLGVKWSTSWDTTTYGGASDMWGTTLSQADIIDSTFGCDLSMLSTSGIITKDGEVDYVKIRVYYTPPPGGSQVIFINEM